MRARRDTRLATLMAELQREEISKRIKQAREEAGLSQNELGDALNVHWRTIQNYESIRVPFRLLGQIADITGKSLEWLLHGDTPDLMGQMSGDSRLSRVETALENQLQLLLAIAQRLGVEGAESPSEATERALDEILQWLERAASEREAARSEARNRAAGDGSSREQR